MEEATASSQQGLEPAQHQGQRPPRRNPRAQAPRASDAGAAPQNPAPSGQQRRRHAEGYQAADAAPQGQDTQQGGPAGSSGTQGGSTSQPHPANTPPPQRRAPKHLRQQPHNPRPAAGSTSNAYATHGQYQYGQQGAGYGSGGQHADHQSGGYYGVYQQPFSHEYYSSPYHQYAGAQHAQHAYAGYPQGQGYGYGYDGYGNGEQGGTQDARGGRGGRSGRRGGATTGPAGRGQRQYEGNGTQPDEGMNGHSEEPQAQGTGVQGQQGNRQRSGRQGGPQNTGAGGANGQYGTDGQQAAQQGETQAVSCEARQNDSRSRQERQGRQRQQRGKDTGPQAAAAAALTGLGRGPRGNNNNRGDSSRGRGNGLPAASDPAAAAALAAAAAPAAPAARVQPQRQRAAARTPRDGRDAPAPASGGGGAAVPAAAAETWPALGPEDPHVTCVICYQEMPAVCVGSCNHSEVCAQCCLRLRLLYKDTHCPLCKQANDEVVIVRPPANDTAPPVFTELMKGVDKLWTAPKWARGVYVQSVTPGCEGQQRPLHTTLQRMTALSCPKCDGGGLHPFMTTKKLQEHTRTKHNMSLCQLCATHGHLFPLECQLYTPQDLAQHQQKRHPECKFCRVRFYGNDELFYHMQHDHEHCHVCRRVENEYVYFRDMPKLMEHMRTCHYLCEEPECADCQIAFATQEELVFHIHRRHNDGSRNRQSLLRTLAAAGAQHAAPAGGGPSGVRLRGVGPQRAPEPRDARGARGGRGGRQLGDVAESAGGLVVIDDDRGMSGADLSVSGGVSGGVSGAARNGGGGQAGVPAALMLQGAWGGHAVRPPGGLGGEEFPSLQAAAHASTPSHTTNTSSGPSNALRKVSARCPCGRRVINYALREGQPVPTVSCDLQCTAQQRRQTLADAFGVSDPDHHVSSFDRHRDVTYSPTLIQCAMSEGAWIGAVERDIHVFVSDPNQRRVLLQPMSARQRALVHELAEAYGLATAASGHEPNRRIGLIKTAASRLPRASLMSVAHRTTPEELEALKQSLFTASEAAKLRFVDLAPGVNLKHYLREWQDHIGTINYTSQSTAEVSFTKESALKSALATLGGGIRGVFRIERPAVRPPHMQAQPANAHPQPQQQLAPARAAVPAAAAAAGRGSSWLVMSSRRKAASGPLAAAAPAAAAAAPPAARSARLPAAADPWLTADEAAQAEREAHEAATRAAHAEDFVFDSWEQLAEEATSVFPSSGVHVVHDSDTHGGVTRHTAVIASHEPLQLDDNPWEALQNQEGDDGEHSQGGGGGTSEDAGGQAASGGGSGAASDSGEAGGTSEDAGDGAEHSQEGNGTGGDTETQGASDGGTSKAGLQKRGEGKCDPANRVDNGVARSEGGASQAGSVDEDGSSDVNGDDTGPDSAQGGDSSVAHTDSATQEAGNSAAGGLTQGSEGATQERDMGAESATGGASARSMGLPGPSSAQEGSIAVSIENDAPHGAQ